MTVKTRVSVLSSSTISSLVRKVLKYIKTGEILDLGAGNGRHSFFLAKKGFQVTAVDVDKNKLLAIRKMAKKKELNISVKLANIATFKPVQKYDLILATMSLHFLTKKQVPKAIKTMQQSTKSDGLNAISVHTNKNTKGSRPYLFKPRELKKYYSHWDILYYWEGLGRPFMSDRNNKPQRKYRASIIAKNHLKYRA